MVGYLAYEVCLKKKQDCVCCMNMMYSSDKSVVGLILWSIILGCCVDESSALCNNHTLSNRFFCSGTSVNFALRLLKELWLLLCFCLVVKRWTQNNELTWSFLFDLGKILKLSSCFKKFMEMTQYQDLGCLSGTRGFEKEEKMLVMITSSKSGRPSTSRTSENIQHEKEKSLQWSSPHHLDDSRGIGPEQ